MLECIKTAEGEAMKRGVKYEVADGALIPDEGEKVYEGVTEEGNKRRVVAQVCGVNKSLLSVRKITKAGNRVVLEDGYGYIEDKQTTEKIWMEVKRGCT